MRRPGAGPEPGRLRRAAVPILDLLARPRAIPYLIVGTTALLLSLGLIMVWSASSISSLQSTGSSLGIVTKQGLFAVVGIAGLVAISRLPVSRLRLLAAPFLLIVLAMLVLVLIPGIGIDVGGQRNWIGVGSTFRVQPSEFAKLALILWSADILGRRRSPHVHGQSQPGGNPMLTVLIVGLLIILLVLAEGDFGNAMILTVILSGILFVAGAPMRLFSIAGSLCLVAVAFLAWTAPYRIERFTSFLNPSADRLDGAWQVTQGMVAFGTGGVFGVGLGASREKWGTLPAAHTDFIFAVIGEELGLVGTISVLVLFGLLIYAILRLVQLTSERFVAQFATGLAVWLMIQLVTNIGATLKLLPITGVTLPFLSYGGSSLIPILMGIGIVLVLARHVVHGSGGVNARARGGSQGAVPTAAEAGQTAGSL